MAAADRIAFVNKGRLTQSASPEELYNRPADAFVADFIGKANFFTPVSVSRGAGVTVETADLGALTFDKAPEGDLRLAIRPEKLRLGQGGEISLTARLGDVAFQGEHSVVELTLPSGRALIASAHGAAMREIGAMAEGAEVTVGWDRVDMLVLGA